MNTDWLGLADRIAVVTGAAGGMGRAIAQSFVEAGAAVALLDRDQEGLRAIEQQLQAAGGRVAAIRCDTGSEASIADAARACADKLGPADILVNNAGILRSGPLATLPLEEWNTLMAVNLTGYLLCAQAFRPQMLGRPAALVHIASIAASNPQPRSGGYSPSKAAVAMLSRQFGAGMGTGRHPQQHRQPRDDPHTDVGDLLPGARHQGAAGSDGARTAHRHRAGHRRCSDLPGQPARQLRNGRRDPG